MKIGFFGLGRMGKHMAMNMLKSGAELIVSDVRPDIFPEFEIKGAKASSIAQDLIDSDIIFLCLPDSCIFRLQKTPKPPKLNT